MNVNKKKSEELWECFEKAKQKGDHIFAMWLAMNAQKEEKKERMDIDKELQEKLNRFDPLKVIADWENAEDIAYHVSEISLKMGTKSMARVVLQWLKNYNSDLDITHFERDFKKWL